MLKILEISVSKDSPENPNNFGGHIEIFGLVDKVVEIAVQLGVSTLQGEEDGLQRQELKDKLRRVFSQEDHAFRDISIWGEDGKKRLLRLSSDLHYPQRNLTLRLVGGENRTTFAEMEAAFNQAVEEAFQVLQTES